MRKLYDPSAPETPVRFEWVTLDKGDVCVHGLTLSLAMQITERAARPSTDARGGVSRAQSIVIQIMLSCHYGEEAESKRVFTDADFSAIHSLKLHEFEALYAAINRVNGKSATEEEQLRDFTTAMEAATS